MRFDAFSIHTRACLKNDKTPKGLVFLSHSALLKLDIHKGCLRFRALIAAKIPRHLCILLFFKQALV